MAKRESNKTNWTLNQYEEFISKYGDVYINSIPIVVNEQQFKYATEKYPTVKFEIG